MSSHHDHRLRDCVTLSVERYFQTIDGTQVRGLYQLVLTEIEKPLLEQVLKVAGGNQSLAATMLGINRNTLRTKLQRYGIIYTKNQCTQMDENEQ